MKNTNVIHTNEENEYVDYILSDPELVDMELGREIAKILELDEPEFFICPPDCSVNLN